MTKNFLAISTIRILLIGMLGFTTALSQVLLAQPTPTDLSGFTADEIFEIRDGQRLHVDDPNMARMLFRANKTTERTLKKFGSQNQGTTLPQIVQDPRSYRGYVLHFSGTAISVRQYDVNDSKFSLIHAIIHESDCLIALPPNGIPKRWPNDRRLNEPIEFHAFFLANFDFHPSGKIAENTIRAPSRSSTSTLPLLVAKSLQWRPTNRNELFDVSESELLLAKNGVDITRLDRVRENAIGKIDQHSAQSFYETLNAAANIETHSFPANKVDFISCLQNPSRHQSAAVRLNGQVRRITEIKIDDPYYRSRGLSNYFQVDLFVPLENHKIVFRFPDAKSNEPIVHENRFPITVCIPHIANPKRLDGKHVTIDTFFFQRWNFESEQTQSRPNSPRQDAPLFIGLTPMVHADSQAHPLNFWIGLVASTSLIGVGLLYWFFGRSTGSNPHSRNDQENLPAQIEITGLDE